MVFSAVRCGIKDFTAKSRVDRRIDGLGVSHKHGLTFEQVSLPLGVLLVIRHKSKPYQA